MSKIFNSIDQLIISLNENSKKIKLVHCHGVFDLLHIGHINYLKEAKKLGDRLLVTITSDFYVNKGIFNPHFNQNIRAEVLSSLSFVDYVFIINAKTPIKFIKKIKPNFYVKGPDYKNIKNDNNLNSENKAIISVGGKMVFTSGGTSSSSMLLNKYSNMLNPIQKDFINKIKKEFTFDYISKKIDSLSSLNVLLIGETIIDEYVFSEVIGKSGKEPILVSKKINSEKYAGGIIAVANHISSFCKKVKVLTYLGETNNSYSFINKKIQKNINVEYIAKKNSPTIIKTRFVDAYSNNKLHAVYNINDDLLNKNEENEFIKKIDKNINKYDLVLVVDYGHGLFTEKIVKNIEKKSKNLSVNSQLNSMNMSFYSHSKFNKIDYFCIHDGELRHSFREKYLSTEKLIKSLVMKLKIKTVVITMGKEGSICFKNNKFFKCPAFVSNPIDTVGAGDTLFAITSLCFNNNFSPNIAILIGNVLASKSINIIGTGNYFEKQDLKKIIKYLIH